jgi:hypothetical protein
LKLSIFHLQYRRSRQRLFGVPELRLTMAGQKAKSPAGKGAGRGKKPASAGKKVEDEREETLQAVV